MCYFYRGFIKGGLETSRQLRYLLERKGQLDGLMIDTKKALDLIFFYELTKSISDGLIYFKENALINDASSSWIEEGLFICDDTSMNSSLDSYFWITKNFKTADADSIINDGQKFIQLKEKMNSMKRIEAQLDDALANGNIAPIANYLRNSTHYYTFFCCLRKKQATIFI